MVIRVQSLVVAALAAQELKSAVGDDLVDVHVVGSSRPRLKGVELELLGITPAGKKPEQKAEPGAEGQDQPGEVPELDPLKLELERQLSAQELAERFEEAVRQMGESADRIQRAGDVGVLTQRLHAEILRNLELIIKQSNQGQGSSGEQSQASQDEGGQQRPTSQQQQQQGEGQAGKGENKGQALMPPAMVDAERRGGQLETARAAWGNLPERVRESLLQGSSDYFSAIYEAMTEAYYKKLAEEGKE